MNGETQLDSLINWTSFLPDEMVVDPIGSVAIAFEVNRETCSLYTNTQRRLIKELRARGYAPIKQAHSDNDQSLLYWYNPEATPMQTFWDMWDMRVVAWTSDDDSQPALKRLGLVKVEQLSFTYIHLIFQEGAKMEVPVIYNIGSFCVDMTPLLQTDRY